MAKRKSDSDKDDALLPSDILESSPKAKVQCHLSQLCLCCRKVAIRLLL